MNATSFQLSPASTLTEYASGRWYPINAGGISPSTSQGNGTLKAHPATFRQHGILDGLLAEWSSAGQEGSALRLGVYADAGGLPGALLLDAGAASTAAENTVQTWAVSLAIRANTRCWFAAVVQGADTTQPGVYAVVTTPWTLPTTAGATPPTQGFGPRISLIHDGTVAGALPATFNATGSSGSMPASSSSSPENRGDVMATVAERVSVTTTATKVTGVPLIEAAGQSLVIQPIDGEVRLGGSGVTWAAGFPLPQGEKLGVSALEDLYAIAESGTVVVAVLRQLAAPAA
jgi:hypothetical protein